MTQLVKIPELEELLKTYKPRREWTDDEMKVLERYYGKVPATSIAKAMGRTTSAVLAKAGVMGLRGM